MPWDVRRVPGVGWAVVKKDSGKVVARHPSKVSADRQVRALYANTKGER